MDIDVLRKEITIYLNELYDCKYNMAIYKELKINNKIINDYSYLFIVILNSLIYRVIVKFNSNFSNDNEKNINKLLVNCEMNKQKSNDVKQLEKIVNELQTVFHEKSELFDNIKLWRDKNFAHSDSKYFGKIEMMLSDYPIINEDIIDVINTITSNIEIIYKLFNCNGSINYTNEIKIDLEKMLNNLKKDLNK